LVFPIVGIGRHAFPMPVAPPASLAIWGWAVALRRRLRADLEGQPTRQAFPDDLHAALPVRSELESDEGIASAHRGTPI